MNCVFSLLILLLLLILELNVSYVERFIPNHVVAGSKAAAKELERIDLAFGQYADKNEDLMIG